MATTNKLNFFRFFFISILGVLLHFTYEWSNDNPAVGLFSAVNESTWEHLKLIFFPMLLLTTMEFLWAHIKDKPLPEHLIDCASALLTLLKVCVVAAVTDVRNRENRRLSGDNAAADFGFHCRQNSQSVKGTLNFKHDFVKHGWLSSPFSANIAQIGE